jgi:hypothetical protein
VRGSDARTLLIKEPLEADEHLADLLGPSEIGHGVGDRVVIFKVKQRRQFLLIEFIHADVDVMRQNKVEKNLLLGVKPAADNDLGLGGPFLT